MGGGLFSSITFEPAGIAEGGIVAMEQALKQGAKVFWGATCSGNVVDIGKLHSLLKSLKAPFFGGVFPLGIYRQKQFDRGSLIRVLDRHVDMATIQLQGPSEELDVAERQEDLRIKQGKQE